MDDTCTGSTWPQHDSSFMGLACDPFTRDSSAFASQLIPWAPAPSPPDTSALPGELLTEAVAENLEARRLLLSVFRKLAKSEKITRSTLFAVEGFLDALPRAKRLPTVSPDGEGGITLAWPVHGLGRTLVTVADGMLYAVGNAGTQEATYLPDLDFTGTIPEDLLALIP